MLERGSSLCKRQRNQQHPSCAGAGRCYERGAHRGAGEPWPPNQEKIPGSLARLAPTVEQAHPTTPLSSRPHATVREPGRKASCTGPPGCVLRAGNRRVCPRASTDPTPVFAGKTLTQHDAITTGKLLAKPLSAPQGTSLLALVRCPGAHLADRSRSPRRSPAPSTLVSAPPPLSAHPRACSVAASGGAVLIERPALSAAPAKTRENANVKLTR